MKNNDKTMGAILFGVLFVVILKITQLIISYCSTNFVTAHPYVSNAIAVFIGVIVALVIVNKFFTNPFGQPDKK